MNFIIKLVIIFLPFLAFSQNIADQISGVALVPEIISYTDSLNLPICEVTLFFQLEDSSSIDNISLVIGNTQTNYFDESFDIASLYTNPLVHGFSVYDGFYEIVFQGIVVPPDFTASYMVSDAAGNNSSSILID